MSEKEDYADNDLPRPWFLRFLFRRLLPISVLLLLIGTVVVALFVGTYSDKHYMTHKTISDAANIVGELYLQKNAGREYPVKLTDFKLIDVTSRNDAWGNPFRYALVTNEAGEIEPHVWSERTIDGKTRLIGAKVTADGTVVRFGLPTD